MTDLHSISSRSNRFCEQHGFSLVELMISLTIGLLLLAGVTALIVKQSQTRDELERASRQIENGRYAIQILHDDIQHAGFYGQYFSLGAASAVIDPCTTTLTDIGTALPTPIQGYDNTLPTSNFSCALDGVSSGNNAANYVSGTDILVVRRASTARIEIASAVAGLTYIQSNSSNYVLEAATGTTATDEALFNLISKTDGTIDIRAPIRTFLTHIYFVSPCSMPASGQTSCTSAADNGKPIPTLKMLELGVSGGSRTFTLTRLVEGIENMQLDYGIDNDGDGAPDDYDLPTSADGWNDVMTVRVNLLARNTECSNGYTDNKTYQLGATTVSPPTSTCPNGDYKRHAYSELVQAVNPSGRREQ